MEKRFKVSRYVFLSLAFLTNAFLIVYSALSAETTAKWNNFVTNIFAGLVNRITEKEVKTIPVEQLNIALTENNDNYAPGYKDYEIPLGSFKQLGTSYLPIDATDKSVTYYADDTSMVTLEQSGSTVFVIGMKEGATKIHAKNTLSGLDVSYDVAVVPTVAPTAFDIHTSRISLPLGSQETISFNIDGGPLGNNELTNFRYYDIRKLSYVSSDETIASVNNYGVIIPKSLGTVTITVSNGDYSKQLQMMVSEGSAPSDNVDLHIEGSNICYGNDMINDEQSGHNYPLTIYDGDKKLNANDFIWESSNELLVKVDVHGVMRGFRKSIIEDEEAVITATSKLTGQSVGFNVTVKEELPTYMNHWIVNGDKTTWGAPKEYTTCVGDNLVLNANLAPHVSNNNITYTVSNSDVIECTYQGSSLSLRVLKEGVCIITITSVANPELSSSIKFTILKAGSINTNDLENVGLSLRKTIGHASMFAIAEAFTLLGLYMFLYDKKHWIVLVISIGIELVVASSSEIVQRFIPSRFGSFFDVGINMIGVFISAIILVLIYCIVKVVSSKKRKDNE